MYVVMSFWHDMAAIWKFAGDNPALAEDVRHSRPPFRGCERVYRVSDSARTVGSGPRVMAAQSPPRRARNPISIGAKCFHRKSQAYQSSEVRGPRRGRTGQ